MDRTVCRSVYQDAAEFHGGEVDLDEAVGIDGVGGGLLVLAARDGQVAGSVGIGGGSAPSR